MKPTKYHSLIAAVLAWLAVVACGVTGLPGITAVEQTGELETREFDVTGYDAIDLQGFGTVIVTQDGGEGVTLEADAAVLDLFAVETQGRNLFIGLTDEARGQIFTDVGPITFRVSADTLRALTVSGSGQIDMGQLNADDLELNIDGSGTITIEDLAADTLTAAIDGSGVITTSGAVREQDVRIGGSGQYEGGDLETVTTDAQVEGSGTATVWATGDLVARVSGSGTVEYYGDPDLDREIEGSGAIESLGNK